MPEQKNVKVGDKVHIISAWRKRLPAKVTKVHKDGCVNVELEDENGTQMHLCPPLPDGQEKADHWTPIPDEPKAEEAVKA
jgi:hypothetical protein